MHSSKMTSHGEFSWKRRHFQRRKRILRVREIMEQIEDKSSITPELIMETFKNTSMDDQEPISEEEAWRSLRSLIYRFEYTRRLSSMDHNPSRDWQPDRLIRFKYVVWKLGGVDRATPDQVLEAMRINCDHDYYLTLDDVAFNLSANVAYLNSSSKSFARRTRMYDSMFCAPRLIDDPSESLSLDLEKLSMGANKNEIRGSGGPMRRARRVNAAVDSNLYTKMDVVDD